MQRTQIMLEPEQHQALTEIARNQSQSLSALIREMLRVQLALYRQRDLAYAAQALLHDYQSDSDLTVFTALDAEGFHAEG